MKLVIILALLGILLCLQVQGQNLNQKNIQDVLDVYEQKMNSCKTNCKDNDQICLLECIQDAELILQNFQDLDHDLGLPGYDYQGNQEEEILGGNRRILQEISESERSSSEYSLESDESISYIEISSDEEDDSDRWEFDYEYQKGGNRRVLQSFLDDEDEEEDEGEDDFSDFESNEDDSEDRMDPSELGSSSFGISDPESEYSEQSERIEAFAEVEKWIEEQVEEIEDKISNRKNRQKQMKKCREIAYEVIQECFNENHAIENVYCDMKKGMEKQCLPIACKVASLFAVDSNCN